MTLRKHKKPLKHQPPPPWLEVETDPVKIFYILRQPIWNIIKCSSCGKIAIAPSNIIPIHVSKDHINVYEAVVAGLTWKQAREMVGNSYIFGIFIKENTREAWKKAIQGLDDLGGVETDHFEQK